MYKLYQIKTSHGSHLIQVITKPILNIKNRIKNLECMKSKNICKAI